MINKIKIALISVSVFLPMVSSAQSYLNKTTGIATQAKVIINTYLIPIAFALALLYFFWGVAKYIRSAGEEKEEGRKILVWGVVALFVMTSIWGLVRFIQGEFGVEQNSNINIPTINGGSGGNINL